MNQQTSRQSGNGTSAILSGGALGGVLVAWLVLALFAPGLGSVIAVFGSPVFAFFVIVRLLTLGPSDIRSGPRGATATELAADPKLLAQVCARDEGRCSICSAPEAMRLHAILPVGRRMADLERRFVLLCDRCHAARTPHTTPA